MFDFTLNMIYSYITQSGANLLTFVLNFAGLSLSSAAFIACLLVLFWYESVRILHWVQNPNMNIFFFPSWTVFLKMYEVLTAGINLSVWLIALLDRKIRTQCWTSYEEMLYCWVWGEAKLTQYAVYFGFEDFKPGVLKQCSKLIFTFVLGIFSGINRTFLQIKYCILFTLSFFKLAFFSAYVTWLLFIFYYRIFLDQDLYPRKRTWSSIRGCIASGYTFAFTYYAPNLPTTPAPSLAKQAFVERLLSDLIFLKRYYRLNDLIWQDGMLIDFLQKKVVDRWVRTFVIYSGYLFNERVVFDFVVRFYIDYIIWPTYRTSIYEFNNVAATLSWTLFLMILFFFVFSLYYISFFFL